MGPEQSFIVRIAALEKKSGVSGARACVCLSFTSHQNICLQQVALLVAWPWRPRSLPHQYSHLHQYVISARLKLRIRRFSTSRSKRLRPCHQLCTLSAYLHVCLSACLSVCLRACACLQVGCSVEFVEADGQVVEVSCIEGKPRNVFEKWDSITWQLKQTLSRVMGGQQQQQAPAGGS